MAIAFASDRHPDEGVRSEVGYLAPIEGLRGVAVLWVVAFHYVVTRDGAFADPWVAAISAVHPLNVLARNGYLGVDLFFLLTGFLLALPWMRHAAEGRPPPAARDYFVRRVRRIVPAYYVQLAVLFLVVLPLLRGPAYWRADLYVIAFNALSHASFLHNMTPLTSGSLGINGALWTLAVEAQWYLLLPLLAPRFVARPVAFTLAAFAIAIGWQLGARHDLRLLVDAQLALGRPWEWPEAVVRQLLLTQLPSYLGHFAIGMVAGRYWLAHRDRVLAPGRRNAVLGAALAALAALYAIFGHLGAFLGDLTWVFTPLALGVVVCAAAVLQGTAAGAAIACAPLAFAGRVSYSAYLFHLPLLHLWNRFAPPDLGWASAPAWLALLAAVSWLSWRFVELPFMKRLAPGNRNP